MISFKQAAEAWHLPGPFQSQVTKNGLRLALKKKGLYESPCQGCVEVAAASGVTERQNSGDDMKFSHSRSPPHPSLSGLLLYLQLKRTFF